MEKTLESTITRYRKQFGQLDGMVAQMNKRPPNVEAVSASKAKQFHAL